MDIDDILASVDRGTGASTESTALDHQLLTRFWVAERSVSEVLPWPAALMERMMDRVRTQIETIEDLASSTPDTENPNTTTTTNSNSNPNLNLRLSILQTDLSRTQYILRSILRQRLAKLTKYSMHYLVQLASRSKNPLLSSSSQSQSQPSTSTSSSQTQPEDSVPDISSITNLSPLSAPESTFIHTHQTLLAQHYGSSFLSAFPRQLRRLDDNVGGTRMVQGPELREPVFVRCLSGEVPVFASVSASGGGAGIDEDPEEIGVTMRMGDVWVVRWEGVRSAWVRGEVELL